MIFFFLTGFCLFALNGAVKFKAMVNKSPNDCQCDCVCKVPKCNTYAPSMSPTSIISTQPTLNIFKTLQPSLIRSAVPSFAPTDAPTSINGSPTQVPVSTQKPSQVSAYNPSSRPTSAPSAMPTSSYTIRVFTPTSGPTGLGYTHSPTDSPSDSPVTTPADDDFSFKFTPSQLPTEVPASSQVPTADDDFSFKFTEKPTVASSLLTLSPSDINVSREPSFKPSFRTTTAPPSSANGDATALCAIAAKTNIMSFSAGDEWSCATGLPTSAQLCQWDGVTCSSEGRVIALYPNKGLNGTLAGVNLAQMTKIESIFLINGALIGSLPSSIGQLPKIRELIVANNDISGVIPPSYSSLSTLTSLQIFNNRITGSIPASLSQLTRLRILNLQSNFLTGEVPSSLCTIGLTSIKISGNDGLVCYPGCLETIEDHDFGSIPKCI